MCAVGLARSDLGVAAQPPVEGRDEESPSWRTELSVLRAGRMWIVLGIIVLAQVGFLGAYIRCPPGGNTGSS